MAWAKPQHTRGKVDAAGEFFAHSPGVVLKEEFDQALAIINNWRSSHSYPLLMLRITLASRAKRVSGAALVAQRLKRLASIEAKLKDNTGMHLSRMHDIGGCRAIVGSAKAVDELVALYEKAQLRESKRTKKTGPEFVKKYDYIAGPKVDGYRSVHLVYKYRSADASRAAYNGLRIEIQIRSRLQHAWAMAVETVSIFTGKALRSSVGDKEWKRFFVLMSAFIARGERRPPVPGAPVDPSELLDELGKLATKLRAEETLEEFGLAAETILQSPSGAQAFLLVLDSKEKTTKVTGYRVASRAAKDYLAIEKQIEPGGGVQAVLVSVSSLAALQKAYPSFYLDTREFVKTVKRAMGLWRHV